MADTHQGSEAGGEAIRWYRCPVSRETLRALTERSDLRGLLQAGGYLACLAVTGAALFVSWRRLPIPALPAILFLHGTLYAFLLNGFHELVHNTVFRTRALNTAFLWVYSFLSLNNPVAFRASHARHHASTLHASADGEVVLPIRLTLGGFLASAVVDPRGLVRVVVELARLSLGIVAPGWELTLFPPSDAGGRRRLFRWARIILFGHAAIVAVSAATGLWPLALAITAARFVGGWLQGLCNNTQHVGLRGNVPDFRLCCRSFALNPVVRFLYFQMNWHTEHHMYAAVPCYRLAALRRAIDAEMPPLLRGLVPAWREIAGILRIQRRNPGYEHATPLPPPR